MAIPDYSHIQVAGWPVGIMAYCAYLLMSRHPLRYGTTYIGITNDMPQRIRKHNGEIVGGAKKTARLAPLVLLCTVWGFETHREVLQFEWHWQHPSRSTLFKECRKHWSLRVGAAGRPRELPKSSRSVKTALHLMGPLMEAFRGGKYALDLTVHWTELGAQAQLAHACTYVRKIV